MKADYSIFMFSIQPLTYADRITPVVDDMAPWVARASAPMIFTT